MKLTRTLVNSKVAKRILVLFIACALGPIITFSIISFQHVSQQLKEQSYQQLKRLTKGHSLSLYERLLFLDSEMQIVTSRLVANNGAPQPEALPDIDERIVARFTGMGLFKNGSTPVRIFGDPIHPPYPTERQMKHMAKGKPTVVVRTDQRLQPHIFMLRLISPTQPQQGIIAGEIDPVFLLGNEGENALPPFTKYCVMDEGSHILGSSLGLRHTPENPLASMSMESVFGQTELRFQGQTYLTFYRKIYMKPQFLVPHWTVVLLRAKTDVLKPMAEFKLIFPVMVLVTLLAVLLLSIHYVRKSLVPLELLKKGTHHISKREFEHPVAVHSKDEFEDLAHAFNDMAGQLNRQFKALETKSEIDRAILSAWETRKIIETLITRMSQWFPCDTITVCQIDKEQPQQAHAYFISSSQMKISETSLVIESDELQSLRDGPGHLIFNAEANLPSYLEPLSRLDLGAFLVLPVYLENNIAAIITLAQHNEFDLRPEDLRQARQMAEQVAVALSNSNLIEELNRLNWGTLEALARTVDAKSAWTAGHSERVTHLAVQIGRALNMDSFAIDNLHRAALLHDIGKLGVPRQILDKEHQLTGQELAMIQSHPANGARILEPIRPFADVIPIVRQHHEKFDGTGYPEGLAGEKIALGARILAVADVFDALKSDRPYRKGLSRNKVLEHIHNRSGQHFDPSVVAALFKVFQHRRKAA